IVGLGICGRTYAVYHLGVADPLVERLRTRFRLEHGLLLGSLLALAGLVGGGYIIAQWISRGFGTLGDQRLAIVAATAAMSGMQVIFTSFLLSLLGLGRER
ncbi:MAG: glycosyltransferase family 2 protein, partial [Gaiellaceae bacterium]